MESLTTGIAEHGYAVLWLAVFLEAIGFPFPAAVALLIGGGAAGAGALSTPVAWGGAMVAMLIADILMFSLGRATGWWLLGILCRLSLNPESCILRAANSFFRRGKTVLLFAKFIPGINTLAPPLAGSMNMRFPRFLLLDLAGTALYISTYFFLGYLFGESTSLVRNFEQMSGYVGRVILVALIVYILYQAWAWTRASAVRTVPMVDPPAIERIYNQPTSMIYDVRSHGYYDPRTERIPGSRRLDPHTLDHLREEIPATHQVFLYCTCIREATSARVAHELRKRGVRTTVIRGGLAAWKKAGLPVERVPANEISLLPVFEQ